MPDLISFFALGKGVRRTSLIRFSVGLLATALVAGLAARMAGVGPGSLDASFGQASDGTPDGMVSLSIGAGKDKAESVGVQSDGKIVVLATSTSLEKSENIIVARLNEDGTLDKTFGAGTADGTPDGIVNLSLGSGDDSGEALAIEPDGHIVIVGTSTSVDGKSENIIVARLNEDGTLDKTFGAGTADGTPDGLVSLSLGSGNDSADGLAVEDDGQILVAGTSTSIDGKSENMIVARLNEDGSLDTTFGTAKDGTPDGMVSLSLGNGDDSAQAIAVEYDGQIVVLGTSTNVDGKSENMIVARLNEDGSLDTTFGAGTTDGTPDGFVSLSLGPDDDSADGLALEFDGQIVVVGTSNSLEAKSANIVVARLNEDGSLDTTFGAGTADGTPDGMVNLSLGKGDDEAESVAVDFDGRVVILGTSTNVDGKSDKIIVARLKEDGSLDSTFGAGTTDGTPDGIVSLSLGAANDAGQSVTLEFDGDIVLVGTTENLVAKSRKIVVARLLGN